MRFWEGHAPHTISLIDLKFDTQVQLNVLYKKAHTTIKLRLPRFFSNLHKVKNSKMNRTFDSINTKFGINETDWSKNMAARDPCIFVMGEA